MIPPALNRRLLSNHPLGIGILLLRSSFGRQNPSPSSLLLKDPDSPRIPHRPPGSLLQTRAGTGRAPHRRNPEEEDASESARRGEDWDLVAND